jgi:hypothetical protein
LHNILLKFKLVVNLDESNLLQKICDKIDNKFLFSLSVSHSFFSFSFFSSIPTLSLLVVAYVVHFLFIRSFLPRRRAAEWRQGVRRRRPAVGRCRMRWRAGATVHGGSGGGGKGDGEAGCHSVSREVVEAEWRAGARRLGVERSGRAGAERRWAATARVAVEAGCRSVSHEVAEAEWRAGARRLGVERSRRARGDGAWRLGRRRQGSWRRASAASSPAEVDDRSGDGKGRGVGPQLLVHQPRWMIGATSVAEACSVRFFWREGSGNIPASCAIFVGFL